MTKAKSKLITRAIAAVFIYSVVLLSIIPLNVSAFEDYCVITSYSIHYTKLYELQKFSRLQTSSLAKP